MIIDEEVYLEHFGIKGMKWGSRHDGPAGVSKAVNKHARKDAEEFARAKSFYGDGAGTRRKLIKQTVEGKSKRMPGYQIAFNHHLEKQDSSKHASKAISERHRKDSVEKNKQRVGAVARRATGEMGTQAAFVAVAAGGAAYLRTAKGQATMKKTVNKVKNFSKNQHVKKRVKDFTRLLNDT